MQKIFVATLLALLLVSCGNSSRRNQSDDPNHMHQDGNEHVHQNGNEHVHQDCDDHVHQNDNDHVHQDCDDHSHVHHTKPAGQESFVLTGDESILPGESTGEQDH
jgi:hypothetical protein